VVKLARLVGSEEPIMRSLNTLKFSRETWKLDGRFSSFEFRLLVCQLLNLACLFEQLSSWLVGYALVSLLWQFSIAFKFLRTPVTLLKIVFALSGVTILALSSLSMGILMSMVHLLCLAYILKPLELKKHNDKQQIKLLNLFVLGAALIFQQSLSFAIVVFFLLVVNITLFSDGFITNKKFNGFKLTAVLLGQSLPMAVLLFVAFPKLGPLWQMPNAPIAQVGLSDTVKIGDIANLALSNELAFRVEFEDVRPNPGSLYWRTIVLENFDGVSWTRREQVKNRGKGPTNYTNAFKYSVFVEPNNQYWLFGLDTAWLRDGIYGKNLEDFTIRSHSKITKTTTYSVVSTPNEPKDLTLTYQQRNLNLMIPISSNPRLTEEGRKLRKLHSGDEDIVTAALQTFNKETYRYTLKPPILANNSLDQFYFETKAGFCEHFASSFTYLMRAAGVPARVVVGYLGGEFNNSGNYFSVYQRDAHAWSEVWLASKGWIRVDPTAAVDISRVEQGIYGSLFDEQRELSGSLGWLSDIVNSQWVSNLSSLVDAVDYQWTKWVIGYNATAQMKILSDWFGDYSLIKIAVLMVSILVGTIIYLLLVNLSFQRKRQTVHVKYMNKLRKFLKKKGCPIELNDTGDLLIEKAANFDEQLRRPVEEFVNIFRNIEYCDNALKTKSNNLQKLKKQWRVINRGVRF